MHPGVDPVVVGRARMPSLDQGLELQNARLGFLECLDDAYFGDGQRQHTEAPLWPGSSRFSSARQFVACLPIDKPWRFEKLLRTSTIADKKLQLVQVTMQRQGQVSLVCSDQSGTEQAISLSLRQLHARTAHTKVDASVRLAAGSLALRSLQRLHRRFGLRFQACRPRCLCGAHTSTLPFIC
jgi:hypothetical protein